MADGLHRVLVLARHNAVLLGRDPGPIVSYLAMPLILMTLLEPLYGAALGGGGVDQAGPGALVMFSLFVLNVIGLNLLSERAWHTWDRLRATPARAVELLAGKALPLLAVLLLQQVVLLAFAAAALGLRLPADPLPLVAIGLAWALSVLGAGAALASLARSHGQLGTAADVGALTVTCAGGALVPLATLPGWLQAVAPATPGWWAMTGFQAALAGDGGTAMAAAGVLLLVAVAAGALAVWRIGRGWGRTPLA